MTNHLSLGERVAWYRRRRGMSQEALAGLVGRTADWLQKVERNRLELDRLSVIKALAVALGLSLGDLLADPTVPALKEQGGHFHLRRLCTTLTTYQNFATFSPAIAEVPSIENLRAQVGAIWNSYQSSRYSFATEWLPNLLEGTRIAVDQYSGPAQRTARTLHALAYHAAAAVLTKLGESNLGWIAAERGLAAAREADNPVVILGLIRSVAHTLLANGHLDAATQLVDESASSFRLIKQETPELLSVFGTLLLTGAVSASNQGERTTVRVFLEEAEEVAVLLGCDGNYMWTAFGPTNTAIHRVSTSIGLNDIQVAVELGPRIDVGNLPLERRVRHALDLAHAWSLHGRREQAISTLREAERTAPEQVRAHYLSRRLVLHWMQTQRGRSNPDLVGLVNRMELLRKP